jgi:hypothetical protein
MKTYAGTECLMVTGDPQQKAPAEAGAAEAKTKN